jgi:ribosomal protein S18 acetylase RimI-like enzyme
MSHRERLLLSGVEYRLKTGTRRDCKILLSLMQQAYQELCPNSDLSYLAEIVQQLWSEQTPFWLVEDCPENCPEHDCRGDYVGGVWLGNVIDPKTGDRSPNILLLYVDLRHRRRGLGRALMRQAETWAIAQGYQQLGLHVFTDNTPALALYDTLGYGPQSIFLQKKLCDNR